MSDFVERDPQSNPGQPTLQRSALDMCAGIIVGPPPEAIEIPRRDTLLTRPWVHQEMHEQMPGLPVHTIATYYGTPSPRSWRLGGTQMRGVGRPGTVTVIPQSCDGHWDIDVAGSLSYVFLGADRLQKASEPFLCGRELELLPRLAAEDRTGAHLMSVLCIEAMNPDPSARLFVEHTIDLLCLHLLRTHAVLDRPLVKRPYRGLAQWQVRRVTAYMAEHLHRPISLDELAGIVELSRSHFCTAFRRATGHTPHEWLTLRRIKRAQELLGSTAIPIVEIALAVGYRNASAFSFAFRRCTGVSPGEFKRQAVL